MSTTTKPTILFFGATGGVTLNALIHTLRAGYTAIAMVRTPSKLTALLSGAGISSFTMSSLLTIHGGDALDVSAVKKALLIREGEKLSLPATIISGLGGVPKLQFTYPFLSFDTTICQTAAATLLTALQELYTDHPALEAAKPLLGFVSTTGISQGPEDVPFWIRFLYHQILHVPHLDKRAMESLFRGAEGKTLRAVVGVRPTLLTDGKAVGVHNIRVGREAAPEMGYMVSRADVGEWIFQNVIETGGEGWTGDMASLTN